jgi:hypothetical protein
VEHPTAERPLRLAYYTLGAGGTGYPRYLVTHHSRAQPGHPGQAPPEARLISDSLVLFGVNADSPCVRVPGSVTACR